MRIQNSVWMFLILMTAGLSRADVLHRQYTEALSQAEEMAQLQKQQIVLAYLRHLDSLISAAQPRGDIESIVVYLDEKENPGAGEAPPTLVPVRAVLDQQFQRIDGELLSRRLGITEQYIQALQRQIETHVRANEVEQASALSPRLEEARAELARLRPPAEPDPEPSQPELRLGPNLLPGGNFEDGAEERWRLTIPPNTRNRTAFFSESNFATGGAGRNRVLRLEQDSRHTVGATHRIRVNPDTDYLISWNVRLTRPWRPGIELRGYGSYEVGFVVSSGALRHIPLAQQPQVRRRATRQVSVPREQEWTPQSIRVRAHPHMDTFEIAVSSGEGEWVIDDIEVREILPEN